MTAPDMTGAPRKRRPLTLLFGTGGVLIAAGVLMVTCLGWLAWNDAAPQGAADRIEAFNGVVAMEQ